MSSSNSVKPRVCFKSFLTTFFDLKPFVSFKRVRVFGSTYSPLSYIFLNISSYFLHTSSFNTGKTCSMIKLVSFSTRNVHMIHVMKACISHNGYVSISMKKPPCISINHQQYDSRPRVNTRGSHTNEKFTKSQISNIPSTS